MTIASHPPPAAAISSLLLRRLLHPCSPAAAHPLQLLGIRSVSFSNSSIIVLHLRRLFCESGFVCAPPFFSDEFLHLCSNLPLSYSKSGRKVTFVANVCELKSISAA
ncbi:hypothetical protein L2E82_31468 [Cichorium intybus]|uniref:Uncharacterized protein n=1 Tax=Cichorium intybus TaxID=13427 RepID=A0ACB9D3D9_CICIN|nr:hypothetical protein L2E82_31468 [Cichorium intybus]